MTAEGNLERARLRPHHVFCKRFLNLDQKRRGGEFERVGRAIKELIKSDGDAIIQVIEGTDELCRSCPDCKNNRCESARGNEDEVRKWDAIILKGLGISYGERRTAQQFRMLIEENAPLKFCRTRCPWKASCGVFERS